LDVVATAADVADVAKESDVIPSYNLNFVQVGVGVGTCVYYLKLHEAVTCMDGSVRNFGCYHHYFDTAFAAHVAVAGDYTVLADPVADTMYFANQRYYYIVVAADAAAAAAAVAALPAAASEPDFL